MKKIVLFIAIGFLFIANASAQQISLFTKSGDAAAYIDYDRSATIFLWSGDPVAFIEDCNEYQCIYNFNGQFLGWFRDGLMYDRNGMIVGAIKEKMTQRTRLERVKRAQKAIPAKPRISDQASPVKSVRFQNQWSKQALNKFL